MHVTDSSLEMLAAMLVQVYRVIIEGRPVLTLPCPLCTWKPISLAECSILSNKSLGGCVVVNLIFLCVTSCNKLKLLMIVAVVMKTAPSFFSQPFRLYCSDKDDLPTSSSKNPERSRDDAIPIN
jgi:hypothetical protein